MNLRTLAILACLLLQHTVNGDDTSNASAPIALDGYCIVSTLYPGVWVKGESDIFTDYRGDRYQFLSEAEKIAFDKAPESFAPMLNGNAVVASFDFNKLVLGKREFGMHYKKRTFFFATEENMLKFQSKPDIYLQRSISRQKTEDRIRDHEAKRGMTVPQINQLQNNGG